MKLISLNIWGGKIHGSLIEFFKEYSDSVDIFCLQDILFGEKAEFSPKRGGRVNIFNEIKEILHDFKPSIFRTPGESHFHDEILDPNVGCGQVIFIRKNLEIKESGGFRSEDDIYKQDGTIASGKYHWIKTEIKGRETLIMNIHGLWQKDSDKKDTPERLRQCELIQNFLDSHIGQKIVCGDLNIDLNTRSMEILGQNLVNLVKEYKISSTRSSLYPKSGKFADYVFVSEGIKIKDFKVLQDKVSDHLPLLLEFE